jgi:hypothetical protein
MKLKECILIHGPSLYNSGNKGKTSGNGRKEMRQTFGDLDFRSGRKHNIGLLCEYRLPIANIRCLNGVESNLEEREVLKAANGGRM